MHRSIRGSLQAFLLVLFLAPVLSPASPRVDQPHAVADPGYGTILFEYYQQNWFAAMSSVLVALESGALPTQKTQARVLLGALYALYGMPDEAEKLFRELLDDAIDPSLAPVVWQHLAELHYRQQRYEDALTLLDERIGTPPATLLRSFHALRTRILMRLGRFEDTSTALAHLSGDTLSHYLRYNLAVSRINAGDGEAGVALLWQVANLPPVNEESSALKDRAMLALGVHYLRTDQLQRAREVLSVSRLEGPYSEAALLLHSRAWLNSEQPEKALSSLLVLSKRSPLFSETQEALLSLPRLYQMLGDQARAAQGYRDAIASYTEHYQYLIALEQQVRKGEWFRELAGEPIWSTAMDSLPDFSPVRVESFPAFRYLFASHAFHRRWRDYHEQLRQIHLLERWQQRLPIVEDMVAAQIRKHREQVPQARDILETLNKDNLPQQRDEMERRFREGQHENDLAMFATARERELLVALDEAETLAARWPERVRPEVKDRLALQKGLLLWQLQHDMVPRQWQRQKQLRSLSPLLAETAELAERVQQAARGDSQRAIALGHQLAGLYDDLSALERHGRELLKRQQQEMEQLALNQLAESREHLTGLVAESWSGLADVQNTVLRKQWEKP